MLSRNTLRINPVNTPCIGAPATFRIMGDRKDVMAERLREARQKAGYTSASAAAETFGWTIPTYISHENGQRGFDVDTALRYARRFKVAPGWLLGLDHVAAVAEDRTPFAAGARKIPVLGSVSAGIWRDETYHDPELPREIEIDAFREDDGEELFAVGHHGQSMNRTLPPGAILICRRIPFGRIEVQPGELVIVERVAHDLREMTVKRLALIDGEFALLSESDRPEFGKPIMIGRPDVEHHADDEVRVIGVVKRAIQTRFPPPSNDNATQH